MEGFNAGLELGISIIKFLTELTAGVIGFILPFVVVYLVLLPVASILAWLFLKLNGGKL